MTDEDIKILEIAVNQFIVVNKIHDFDELQDCFRNAMRIKFVETTLGDIPVQTVLDIFNNHYPDLKKFKAVNQDYKLGLVFHEASYSINVYCDDSPDAVELTIYRRDNSIFLHIPFDIEAAIDDSKIVSLYNNTTFQNFEFTVPNRSSSIEIEVDGFIMLLERGDYNA